MHVGNMCETKNSFLFLFPFVISFFSKFSFFFFFSFLCILQLNMCVLQSLSPLYFSIFFLVFYFRFILKSTDFYNRKINSSQVCFNFFLHYFSYYALQLDFLLFLLIVLCLTLLVNIFYLWWLSSLVDGHLIIWLYISKSYGIWVIFDGVDESCVEFEKDQLMNSLPMIGKLLKIEDESRVMDSNFVMFVYIDNIYVSNHFTC